MWIIFVIETKQEFRVKIGGAFKHLLELGDSPVEELWLDFKETTNEITEKVVGFGRRKQVVNIPSLIAAACDERRKALTKYLKVPLNSIFSLVSFQIILWQIKPA